MFRKFASVALFASLVLSGVAANADPLPNVLENHTSVDAWSTDVYRVESGSTISIQIDGDDDTDLDLYVYDCNGNLIVAGESYSDFEKVIVSPFYRQTLTIKVVNRGGVFNRYSIHVW
jgi:hypothetical protein